MMEELTSGERIKREDKQKFYSELIYVAQSRGYKPGWSAVKYREKFGVYPRGLVEVPSQPSLTTLGWIKSRQIAWAKSRRRQA